MDECNGYLLVVTDVTLIRVFVLDIVAMASRDNWQLGKNVIGSLRPALPVGAVTARFAIEEPHRRMAHFMDQCASQPIRAGYYFCTQFDACRSAARSSERNRSIGPIYVNSKNSAGLPFTLVAATSCRQQFVVPGDGRDQFVVEHFLVVQFIQDVGKLLFVCIVILSILHGIGMTQPHGCCDYEENEKLNHPMAVDQWQYRIADSPSSEWRKLYVVSCVAVNGSCSGASVFGMASPGEPNLRVNDLNIGSGIFSLTSSFSFGLASHSMSCASFWKFSLICVSSNSSYFGVNNFRRNGFAVDLK